MPLTAIVKTTVYRRFRCSGDGLARRTIRQGDQAMAEQRHTGNPGNFAEDREKASRAGQIGGQHSSGNFANDRERAAEAGRKGGENSHGGGGAEHNRGNFAHDRERAAEAGRKGGQH
jgi:general stress protein YciG